MRKSFFTSCFHLIIVCGVDLVDLRISFLKMAIFFKHERKLSILSFCQILFLYLLVLQLLPLVQRCINGSGLEVLLFLMGFLLPKIQRH